MVEPHQIAIPEETLKATRERLRGIRWPDARGADRERYGASVPELRGILEYWAEEYSWRAWEEKLNSRPHFLTTIDGVALHFWHIRAAKPNAIPLLLLHGWPGSAVEFWELIGPLTDPEAHGAPAAPAFDVVIAELPGFGFGGKPTEPGWGPTRMAEALHTLMHESLGYTRYAVHGEDWGAVVAAKIARRHPDAVAALHVTMPFSLPYGEFAPAPEWDAHMYSVSGYSHAQSQVPDALTLGMADSPLALAAWVLEKFVAWSDNDGTLAAFNRDVLVTNLNFYWLTSSIVSATRIYRESALEPEPIMAPPQIPVPAGIAVFPKEPFASPREWLEGVYDVQRYRTFESGGHFAALEQPEVVLSELRAFFPTYIGGPT
ncbi:MAG TPA: epoxide hydrolase [Baekduia sp.]|nr:epoxide hydrolase [Baekduia sp.]